MVELKERGLITKFEVKKLTNPAKTINAVVLEFDDPIARAGILAWAKEMNRHGYEKVYDEVITKLDNIKTKRLRVIPRRYTQELKVRAVKLAAVHGVSAAARKTGVPARALFAWVANSKKAPPVRIL